MFEFSFFLIGAISGFASGFVVCFAIGWRMVARAQEAEQAARRELEYANACVIQLKKEMPRPVMVKA